MSYELAIPQFERQEVRLRGGIIREYVAEPRERSPMQVYCMGMRSESALYIKIGISKLPFYRLQQINTGRGAKMPPEWRGETVDLICTRPGGLPEERQIHRDLHEYRVYGTEWFLGHMAVVDYLNEDPEWRVWWPLTQE